jgi:hypothetical protein
MTDPRLRNKIRRAISLQTAITILGEMGSMAGHIDCHTIANHKRIAESLTTTTLGKA